MNILCFDRILINYIKFINIQKLLVNYTCVIVEFWIVIAEA